jgi:glycosyltransferase involved in cell wall biosynthesis
MRIAIVTELYHPSVGGQEVRYREMAAHLLAAGHTVDVYTIDHKGDLPDEETLEGVPIHRLVRAADYKSGKHGRAMRPIFNFAKALRKRRELQEFDLVLINQWPVLPAMIGRKLGRNTVVDICEFRSGRKWDFLEKRMLRGGHQVSTVSAALAEKARARVPGLKVTSLPSGINAHTYSDQGRDHFLFFGRLSEHKHPEMAIDATLAYNGKHGDSKKIVVAGGGPMLETLRAQHKGNPLVEIPGFISDEEKLDLLSRTELLLLPSIREGFPRVIAEAMACGAPTVTTDVPDNGSRDVVNEFDCGVNVPHTIEGFVGGIEQALADYDRLRWHALEGASAVDWSVIVRRLEQELAP